VDELTVRVWRVHTSLTLGTWWKHWNEKSDSACRES